MLDQPAHKKLYRSLQIRGLARMVTDFRICFAPCYTHTRSLRCKCNKFDTMLGQVLVSLENLRVLEFKCMCCSVNRNARPGRHRYLGELKNNQLKRLLLRCSCSLWPREDAARLLTQSSMHRVTSASIGLFSPVLEDLNYLPRLERLEIHGMKTIEPLFKKKAITHLLCKSYHLDIIHHVLGDNSGILLHISVEHLMDALPSFIKANPGLYQNLRHLGTLHFGLSEVRGLFQDHGICIYPLQFHRDSARASMQSLSCLPHLVSIELRIMTHEGISIDQTAPHLFDDRINRQARGLAPIQKIYVTVVLTSSFEYSYWIWEIGSRWESRKVPGISSWEIMNGDL